MKLKVNKLIIYLGVILQCNVNGITHSTSLVIPDQLAPPWAPPWAPIRNDFSYGTSSIIMPNPIFGESNNMIIPPPMMMQPQIITSPLVKETTPEIPSIAKPMIIPAVIVTVQPPPPPIHSIAQILKSPNDAAISFASTTVSTTKKRTPLLVVIPPVIVTEKPSAIPVPDFSILVPTHKPASNESKNANAVITNNSSDLEITGLVIPNPVTTDPQIQNNYSMRLIEKLCGYPIFVADKLCHSMANHNTLWHCSNKAGVVFLWIVVLLLGVLIIISNCLLPIIMWNIVESRNHHNYIKASLCVIDIVMGFILLGAYLPNLTRQLLKTRSETYLDYLESINQPITILRSVAFTFSLQSSIIHLLLMSVERFLVIQWPIWSRTRAFWGYRVEIASAWVLGLTLAIIPTFVDMGFTFVDSPVLFIPAYANTNASASQDFILPYLIATSVLPYALSVCLTIATAMLVLYKLKLSNKLKASYVLRHAGINSSNNSHKAAVKPEVNVFITTVLMISSFTITLLPITIVTIIFADVIVIDCTNTNYPLPYTISILIMISNSLINPLIYSIRNKNFRKDLSKIFCGKRSTSKSLTPTPQHRSLDTQHTNSAV